MNPSRMPMHIACQFPTINLTQIPSRRTPSLIIPNQICDHPTPRKWVATSSVMEYPKKRSRKKLNSFISLQKSDDGCNGTAQFANRGSSVQSRPAAPVFLTSLVVLGGEVAILNLPVKQVVVQPSIDPNSSPPHSAIPSISLEDFGALLSPALTRQGFRPVSTSSVTIPLNEPMLTRKVEDELELHV